MKTSTILRQFARCESGTTAVEFALVAGAFFMLMMGIIEYGLYTMTQVTVESAVSQAGRLASIGRSETGYNRVDTVKHLITQKVAGLRNAGLVDIAAIPVQGDGAGTAAPDYCLVNGVPTLGMQTCNGPYIDGNHNHAYDSAASTANFGLENELVEIRVTYPWKVLFPVLNSFFGENGVVLITSTIVVKNEPFGVTS